LLRSGGATKPGFRVSIYGVISAGGFSLGRGIFQCSVDGAPENSPIWCQACDAVRISLFAA
jgi:hypothetical protein